MRQVRLYPVALVLLVGGCAGDMGPAISPTPPPPPVTAFDGSYRNTINVAESFGSDVVALWCDSPGQPVITVKDGRLAFAVPHPNIIGNPTPMFEATMSADGTFRGSVIAGTVSGQVEGTHIEGRIDGSACIYTFSGTKV